MKRLLLKYLPLLCLLLFPAMPGRAQFDARFSQYWAVPGYYHASEAGASGKLNIYGAYGMQLMEFDHAPRLMCAGADMPFRLFGRQHGVGAGFFNEGIGLFRNQRFWLQYAYRWKVRRTTFSAALQAGMLSSSFDPDGLNLGDEEEDPAFPSTEESGRGVDLGVSFSLRHPRFFASLSGQHLTAPRLSLGEEGSLKVNPALYFTGGYNIQTRNPLIKIQPSCHLQTDFHSTRLDVTGRLFYTWRERTLTGGLGYSPDTSVTFSLGLEVKSLSVGYAYELFTSTIGAASGSHDIVVSYALDLNVFKKNRNLHKSVRIL